MSSKKILIRGWVDEETAKQFLEEAREQKHKKSTMLEIALSDRYKLLRRGEEVENAKQ